MHETMVRLYEAIKEIKGVEGQSEVARLFNESPQTVKNWEYRGVSKAGVLAASRLLGISPAWVQAGQGEMLASELSEFGYIEYWDIRGSCGGGVLTFDEIPKGKLIKEATFFKKYNIKPENAFSIYADGDSMAEFIVDGDMCIFDRSKTEPISGKIFAIQHPDGLRIKVLRRSIDGSWTLESKNADKRRYPDEVIPPSHADLLKIVGQFVYRQGG